MKRTRLFIATFILIFCGGHLSAVEYQTCFLAGATCLRLCSENAACERGCKTTFDRCKLDVPAVGQGSREDYEKGEKEAAPQATTSAGDGSQKSVEIPIGIQGDCAETAAVERKSGADYRKSYYDCVQRKMPSVNVPRQTSAGCMTASDDPLVGTWKSQRLVLQIKRDGSLYVVRINNPGSVVDGEYAGPYASDQILIGSPVGSIAVLDNKRQLLFWTERFTRTSC